MEYTIEEYIVPVAQLDRASDCGSEGRKFESCRVHQKPLDKSYAKAYHIHMNTLTSSQTLTASEARTKLYSLIKSAGTGLASFEITLKGADPVILISKSELDSWLETLDILSNREEVDAIRKSGKEKKNISHKKMLALVGLENES